MADKVTYQYLDYAGLSLYDQKIKALIAAANGDINALKNLVGDLPEGATESTIVSYLESKINAVDSKVGDISGLTSETITNLAQALSAELERAAQAESELESRIEDLETAPKDILDTEFELVKDSKVAFKLDDGQNDLRILIPDDAVFEAQNSGEGSSPDVYYVGLRCWAPSMDAKACHKGTNEAELATTDAIFFDAKTGRPYADMWLPVARLADGVWTSYVAEQPDGRYPGWNFEIHWLDANGNEINFKARRVSLTNQKNFLNHKDWYIGSMESSIATLKSDVATLTGDGKGSVNDIVAAAVAKVVDGADAKFDTLKEIAEWILADETGTADLLARVDALEAVEYTRITDEQILALFTSDEPAPGV